MTVLYSNSVRSLTSLLWQWSATEVRSVKLGALRPRACVALTVTVVSKLHTRTTGFVVPNYHSYEPNSDICITTIASAHRYDSSSILSYFPLPPVNYPHPSITQLHQAACVQLVGVTLWALRTDPYLASSPFLWF